jgi:hypothetical protein
MRDTKVVTPGIVRFNREGFTGFHPKERLVLPIERVLLGLPALDQLHFFPRKASSS